MVKEVDGIVGVYFTVIIKVYRLIYGVTLRTQKGVVEEIDGIIGRDALHAVKVTGGVENTLRAAFIAIVVRSVIVNVTSFARCVAFAAGFIASVVNVVPGSRGKGVVVYGNDDLILITGTSLVPNRSQPGTVFEGRSVNLGDGNGEGDGGQPRAVGE